MTDKQLDALEEYLFDERCLVQDGTWLQFQKTYREKGAMVVTWGLLLRIGLLGWFQSFSLKVGWGGGEWQ